MRSTRICAYESHLYRLKGQFVAYCIITGQAQSEPVSSLQATGMKKEDQQKFLSSSVPSLFGV